VRVTRREGDKAWSVQNDRKHGKLQSVLYFDYIIFILAILQLVFLM
jgi:hypothetical protein